MPFRLLETGATEWSPDGVQPTLNARVDARLVPSLASPDGAHHFYLARSSHFHRPPDLLLPAFQQQPPSRIWMGAVCALMTAETFGALISRQSRAHVHKCRSHVQACGLTMRMWLCWTTFLASLSAARCWTT